MADSAFSAAADGDTIAASSVVVTTLSTTTLTSVKSYSGNISVMVGQTGKVFDIRRYDGVKITLDTFTYLEEDIVQHNGQNTLMRY